MEKFIKLTLVTLILAHTMASCKKDAATKDYGASIKGKTWWGTITYTGMNPEYYSVHFNDDSTLSWTQLSDTYGGRWILDGKHLTLGFTNNSVNIHADISNDDKLENISDNTNYYEINSGQLIPNPKLSLENTVWKGTYSISPYEITFLDGSKLKEKIGDNEHSYNYTRTASGAVIKYRSFSAFNIIGVFTSDNTMKCSDDGDHMMELTKQ